VLSAWQESYICNSNSSSVGCAPGDTPASVPGSAFGYERGRSHHSLPDLFVANGSAPETIGAGGVSARGTGGADAVGAGEAGDVGVGWEQHYPFIGYTCSAGTKFKISVGADRADPWPGDDARSLRRDLVVQGASPSMPEHTAPGDTVPAPEFLRVTGVRVAGLLLLGSPSSPS
jgi:hypothetical protein